MSESVATLTFGGQVGAGKTIKVDSRDYALVSRFTWHCKDGYAVAKKNGREYRMHRLIMGTTDPEVVVDHINGDRADNRRSNLREYSLVQNANNRVDNRKILAFGEWKTIGQWARDPRCGVSYDTLYGRIRQEVWPEFAILAPKGSI